MKRIYNIWKALIQISTCFIFLGVIGCNLPLSKTIELERHLSPDGKNEVALLRSESNSLKYIFLTSTIKNKTIQLQNPLYYEKDWDGDMSPDFESIFKYREWIDNRIFFVGSNDNYKTSDQIVLISNLSSKTIDQMDVMTYEKYIIYGVQPNETVTLPVSWTKQKPYLKCSATVEVNFSDGSKIPLSANIFQFDQQSASQSQCTNGEIIITDSKISSKVLN